VWSAVINTAAAAAAAAAVEMPTVGMCV